jgi:hypothetical protein
VAEDSGGGVTLSPDRVYAINDMAVSAHELIDMARGMDHAFDQCGVYLTSQAAQILRRHGFVVTDLRDQPKSP